jgi:threonine dehydrogenase-like Zn-dependent dehydrogenase
MHSAHAAAGRRGPARSAFTGVRWFVDETYVKVTACAAARVPGHRAGWAGHRPCELLNDRWHVLDGLNFLGIDSAGSMQSSWTVPSQVLVPLPVDVSLDLAALVEPTAVAVHDVRRGSVIAGERVIVVGGGPVGILVALTARVVGADVIVLELDGPRRDIATTSA